MIEHINTEQIKSRNKLYEIKNENSKSFSNFNYNFYHFLTKPLLVANYNLNYLKEKIDDNETRISDYKEKKVLVNNLTSDPVELSLSGFNHQLRINYSSDSIDDTFNTYKEYIFWDFEEHYKRYRDYSPGF